MYVRAGLPALPLVFSCAASPPHELYSLSLHDALPIFRRVHADAAGDAGELRVRRRGRPVARARGPDRDGHDREPGLGLLRSEEHTSELQSRFDLVCRLLLEKKKHVFISLSAHSTINLL